MLYFKNTPCGNQKCQEISLIKPTLFFHNQRLPVTTYIIYRCNWAKQNGIHYQENACVIVTHELLFGKICSVFIIENKILLLVTLLETISYSQHYHAFVVNVRNRYMYVWTSDIVDYHVYGMYTVPHIEAYPSMNFIVTKYNV